MPIYHPSILVSNILDPLTHNDEDLCQVVQHLADMKRYTSIETRLIKEGVVRDLCIKHLKQAEFTFWITGELQRAGLNLSSVDEVNRSEAVCKVKEMMIEAQASNCTWLGIASGCIETTISEGCSAFLKSVMELLEEIKEKNYSFKIIIEPLDQFAHKCNVLGTTETVLSFMKLLPVEAVTKGDVCLCWDSAHMALNEDDFESSFAKLAPYIVRVHFANAVLDKQSNLYGDHHLDFCEEGFLNLESAHEIKRLMDKYLTGDITVAVEIREKERDHAWQLEAESYTFLMQVLQ